MNNILISSFDMEVGGVERSLISMLENIDYSRNNIDLMLYRHQGDFLNLIPDKVNLLKEIEPYPTFRKSILETFRSKQIGIGFSRIFSKIYANLFGKLNGMNESGYYQMQLIWKYALPFLPKINKQYDVAISYLWPHYFVAEKVNAMKKIAWIHTDYSTIETHIKMDLKMWGKFDSIIAVSESCKDAFLKKYGLLRDRVTVMENITSPEFIKKMAKCNIDNPMLNDNRFKILTVARLSHAKGIDNAVRALKKLKDNGFNNIVWYLVGYGGDEKQIRDLITEFNLESQFILLGKQINPYPYIEACDLYVQPSRYEGKAITVTEAKILCKPILITNYTTAKSQVVHGFDGYITELSIDGIVKGIVKLYEDKNLRYKLGKNCMETNYSNTEELNLLYKLIEDDNNVRFDKRSSAGL